ncbi:MAG: hypothetical protein GXP25_20245 [Planctomycetes bacterium]|nr:hypothetical protein [Planctomycetota bacterium]
MTRKLRHVAFFCLCLTVLVLARAEAQVKKVEVKVNEDIVNAWNMNPKQAEAAARNANAKIAVRYIALKKLCDGGYNDKKLIPILMGMLGPGMARHMPIQRLAIAELAKRKYEPAGKIFYMIAINNAANWELRKAAEAGLEQVAPKFPEDMKGALLKAEKKPGEAPDPKKIEEAVKLYKTKIGPLFGQAPPKENKGKGK